MARAGHCASPAGAELSSDEEERPLSRPRGNAVLEAGPGPPRGQPLAPAWVSAAGTALGRARPPSQSGFLVAASRGARLPRKTPQTCFLLEKEAAEGRCRGGERGRPPGTGRFSPRGRPSEGNRDPEREAQRGLVTQPRCRSARRSRLPSCFSATSGHFAPAFLRPAPRGSVPMPGDPPACRARTRRADTGTRGAHTRRRTGALPVCPPQRGSFSLPSAAPPPPHPTAAGGAPAPGATPGWAARGQRSGTGDSS